MHLENVKRGCSNGANLVCSVQKCLHAATTSAFDGISAVNLLRKEREKLVVALFADPNLRPGVAVRPKNQDGEPATRRARASVGQ